MTDSTEAAPIEEQRMKGQYEDRQYYNLKIKDLTPDPNQPRKHFDPVKLNELANTIKNLGVMSPVFFRQAEDGKLVIVAGERRYRAAQLAGLDTIPGKFFGGYSAEIALVENLSREDLTPLEEAEGLGRLQSESGYKNKDLADVIGKADSTVSEILSLNKLTQKIKELIRNNRTYSRRQLVEVAKGKDDKEMNKLFKALKKKNLSKEELKEEREKNPRAIEATFMTMITGLTAKLNEVNLDDLDSQKANDIRLNLSELSNLISKKIVKARS